MEETPYKAEGTAPFRDITRQVLFEDPALACELRYFEMAAGRILDARAARACPCGDDSTRAGPVLVGDRVTMCASTTSCTSRR